ncbi:Methyltransferase domain protein [Lignipirellula cremea]|uniref:Methyltransferase domain protein n=2 Tax=Lignipirellula cremea TaxID=2528010 RepID=A0A518E3X6_9BACT|nr:Methyltransferase domain protein [Lignipirellula cremea]
MPKYWKLIRDAGGNRGDLDKYGPFSPQAGNVFFITEEVAKRSLSAEYEWFLSSLGSLENAIGDLPTPSRIADMGGGVGIASLYLARVYPDCHVTVYDHSPGQLEIGSKWARRSGTQNIEFAEASYKEVAEGRERLDNNVVLFLRGLDLRMPAPGTRDTSLDIKQCPHSRPQLSQELENALGAMSRLLSPQGIGIVAATWSAWGLVNLFEACRHAGLGVDWQQSYFSTEERDGKLVPGDGLIVVRRGIPHLGKDSYEDAQGYVCPLIFRGEPETLSQEELESQLSDFIDADQILFAEGMSPSDGAEGVRLMQKDGILLLVSSEAGQDCAGMIRSLTGIGEILELAQAYLDDWQDGGEVLTFKIKEPLRSYIDFCKQE